ncbi:MAG: ABC transporter permease [Acidimicrobiales bacterium]
MLGYVLRRAALAIPVLLAGTALAFAAVSATTDPLKAARRNPSITQADLAAYRHELGLDRSPPVQYLSWLGRLARGDLGESLTTRRPVWPELRTALVNSLVLGASALAVSLVVGVAAGAVAALRPGRAFDWASTVAGFVGVSIPPFWVGLMLQLLFGVVLARWLGAAGPLLPVAGAVTPGAPPGLDLLDRARHLVLPALTVCVQAAVVYSRYMRTSLLDALEAEHLRAARAKGLGEWTALRRHALRNALGPLTAAAGADVGQLAAGLIVTEVVFQYPGMGVYFTSAFSAGDYMRILPWTAVVVAAVVLANLAADLACAALDPRVRLG